MKIILMTLSSKKNNWVESVISEYSIKISRFINFEYRNLKSSSFSREDHEQKKQFDSKKILESLSNEDYVILCDETGSSYNTHTFYDKLKIHMENKSKNIVFIIGSAYGVNEKVVKRANERLSLSLFTLNHLIAQVVLVEQIYRSITLWKGAPYHNE